MRGLITSFSTITVLLFWTSPDVGATQDRLISTSELLAALQEDRDGLDGVTLRFEVSEYGGQGLQVPSELRADSFIRRRSFATTLMGVQYRIERNYLIDRSASNEVGEKRIATFNGAQYRTLVIPGPKSKLETSLTIGCKPTITHYMDNCLTWQGWRLYQQPTVWSWIDVLKHEDAPQPALLPDGRTVWRYPTPKESSMTLDIYARRVDGKPRFCQTDYLMHELPENDASRHALVCSMQIIYGERRAAEPVSATARHTSIDYRRSQWHVEEVTLESIERAEIAADTFTIDSSLLKDGDSVGDQRYNIAYYVGDTKLNLDGRMLITHEPLHGEVGDRLEWWVAHGMLGPIVDPRAESFAEASDSGQSATQPASANQPPGKVR